MSKITPKARERCACHTMQEQLKSLQGELKELKEEQSLLRLGQLLHERTERREREEMGGPD